MRINRIFLIIIALLVCSLVNSFDSHLSLDTTLLALLLLVVFYRSVVKPIRSIANGTELLKAGDFSSRLAHVGQYEADKIIDMFNSMMTALRNERLALLEQNHLLRLLTEVSPTGVITLDDKDRVATANNAAAEYLDYDSSKEMSGVALDEIPSQLGTCLASLGQGESTTVRLNNSMIYRCSRWHFMDNGYSHPFILIEKLTEEIMKAERKSYGTVIRVIAHEVNNSMAGVDSLLATSSEMTDNEDMAEVLNVCRARCASLGKFISSYADVVKIPDIMPVSTNLNEFINSRYRILESLCIDKDIRLELNLDSRPVTVMMDAVLFEQVLINIVKNSVESISTGGVVTITTTSVPATLTVTNNGAGISDDVAMKLFSPFFTTKPNGQGIGLMFINEVLNRHGCRFSLSTGEDSLTRFRIRF